jgi:hypothetical protein
MDTSQIVIRQHELLTLWASSSAPSADTAPRQLIALGYISAVLEAILAESIAARIARTV